MKKVAMAVAALLLSATAVFAQTGSGSTSFSNLELDGIPIGSGDTCAQSFLAMRYRHVEASGAVRTAYVYFYVGTTATGEPVLRMVTPAALGDSLSAAGEGRDVSLGTGSLKVNLGKCLVVDDASAPSLGP